MQSELLMNCLWYEDLTPEFLADALEITPEALFRKVFGQEEFTLLEIQRLTGLLQLTAEEVDRIFFS